MLTTPFIEPRYRKTEAQVHTQRKRLLSLCRETTPLDVRTNQSAETVTIARILVR
jgi:hypothetical protein